MQRLRLRVAFTVTVPRDVSVTVLTEGGPVTVSGTARTNLESGGAPVQARAIHGPLTVSTGGGSLVLKGLTGPLDADTGGGPLWAQDVDAPTTTVITGGGDARVVFTATRRLGRRQHRRRPATMAVPGGPYALTADSNGGDQSVGIPVSPAARHSITVTSGGGPLVIVPSANRLNAPPDEPPPPPPPLPFSGP